MDHIDRWVARRRYFATDVATDVGTSLIRVPSHDRKHATTYSYHYGWQSALGPLTQFTTLGWP